MDSVKGHIHLADGSVAETINGRVWLDKDGKPIKPTELHRQIGDLEFEIRQSSDSMEIGYLRQKQHNLLYQLYKND